MGDKLTNPPGYSHGFRWTDEAKDELLNLIIDGYTIYETAENMSEKYGQSITHSAVHSFMIRNGLRGEELIKKENIKTYKNLTIPMDDYIISCDYHAPYYSEAWVNRIFMIADRFKIRKHIIAGDLYDFNFMSKFPSEEKKDLDKEIEDSGQIYKILDYFDKTYLIQGNHERRIGNMTEGRVMSRHLFKAFGHEKYEAKIVYSFYDRIQIEDKYMILHPKSYSQISTAVSKRMAEKFNLHILNAHGHFCGLTYDRSGKYMCVDLGGCFDISKIEYCTMRTTSHPFWNNGFGMIRNGRFTLFHKETDWNFWLGDKHDPEV